MLQYGGVVCCNISEDRVAEESSHCQLKAEDCRAVRLQKLHHEVPRLLADTESKISLAYCENIAVVALYVCITQMYFTYACIF